MSWKYQTVGTPETVQIKVSNPEEGFTIIAKAGTAAQVEKGYTGKRLLVHSDHGTIGIDLWNSNTEQVKEVLKTLSAGGEVAMSRKAQHRIDEDSKLVDNTNGIPNVFHEWSLPRVGQSAEAILALL